MKPMSDGEYIANGACQCPFCGSESITISGEWEPEGRAQKVSCAFCDNEWYDLYTLTGYEPA